MAQNVSLTIKIRGKQYSPVSYCSIIQRIDWHHSIEVILPLDGFANSSSTLLDQTMDFIGEKIEVAFKIKKPVESDIQNEFTGIITEICLSRRNRGNKEIIIRGYSPTILMDGRPTCHSFENKTLDDLVFEMHSQISRNILDVSCSPVFTGEIPYIVQYKESNFHFLNRIAAKYGEWCFFDGKKLKFGKLDKSEKIDLPIDKNLSDFDFALNIQNLNHKSFAYDYLNNQTYTEKTNDLQVNDLDNYGNHALSKSEKVFRQSNVFYSTDYFDDRNKFKDNNELQKAERSKDLIHVNGSGDNPFINVGTKINIIGESSNEEDFGEFIILSVNHCIDVSANYVNHFTAIPAQATVPPVNQNITLPLSENQPALVTDNDDPEQLGRVCVRFYWQENNEETPWLRVLQPLAGKTDRGEQHGFYFIPEKGDEVMIGFENDNPDRPYVIGSVYHGNSVPDHWHHPENNIKSIRTRNGNQIIFNDENGNEEIRILNNKDNSPTNEISLSLSDNGKITIKTEGELEISADSIKISAKSDITIDSGQSTKLTANDYSLDANKSIEVSGNKVEIEGTNTSLKGKGQLEIEGGQSDIKANRLSIDGGAQTEMKAAIVKVSGSAQVEVKGGIIMLN